MTLIKNAYESVILTLHDDDKRLDVPRRLIENILAIELGATKPGTLDRNIRIMCDLGYIKLVQRGYGPDSLKYDVVHAKVLAIKKQRKKVDGG